MLKDRDLYISKIWKRYPVAHPDGICGRVRFDDNHVIIIRTFSARAASPPSTLRSPEVTFTLGHLKLPETKELNPQDVIGENDWVSVHDGLITLLAPALSALPSRQPLGEFVHWMRFKKEVAQFFEQSNLIQVQTPTLVVCPGTEPFLEPFETVLSLGSKKQKRYLPTSPEIHLKKLVAQGMGDIFEIRSCFRDQELSPWHQPEFTMLEWYRPFYDLTKIQEDIVSLLEFLRYPIERKSIFKVKMSDLFLKYLNFDLRPETQAKELHLLAQEIGLSLDADASFDDLFGMIFVDQIEPKLKEYDFLFLTGFPPSQAALARIDTEGWGDRFEFYLRGVEIANAFHELNDPETQSLRIDKDLNYRKKLKKLSLNKDLDFIEHLKAGMPPTAGVALGLDRLFMVLNQKKDMTEFRLFPERID